MAREEEPLQPESPLLGEAVQLDSEETLEGDPTTDALDSGYVPPDRPVAVDRYGNTLDEELRGEPLDYRLAREEPDVGYGIDGGDSTTLDTAVDADEEPQDRRAGRLVEDDEGAHEDVEPDLVGHDVGIDGGAASAEEAAVHRRDEDEAELPDW